MASAALCRPPTLTLATPAHGSQVTGPVWTPHHPCGCTAAGGAAAFGAGDSAASAFRPIFRVSGQVTQFQGVLPPQSFRVSSLPPMPQRAACRGSAACQIEWLESAVACPSSRCAGSLPIRPVELSAPRSHGACALVSDDSDMGRAAVGLGTARSGTNATAIGVVTPERIPPLSSQIFTCLPLKPRRASPSRRCSRLACPSSRPPSSPCSRGSVKYLASVNDRLTGVCKISRDPPFQDAAS